MLLFQISWIKLIKLPQRRWLLILNTRRHIFLKWTSYHQRRHSQKSIITHIHWLSRSIYYWSLIQLWKGRHHIVILLIILQILTHKHLHRSLLNLLRNFFLIRTKSLINTLWLSWWHWNLLKTKLVIFQVFRCHLRLEIIWQCISIRSR